MNYFKFYKYKIINKNNITYRLIIKKLINRLSLFKNVPTVTEVIPRGSRQIQ